MRIFQHPMSSSELEELKSRPPGTVASTHATGCTFLGRANIPCNVGGAPELKFDACNSWCKPPKSAEDIWVYCPVVCCEFSCSRHSTNEGLCLFNL